MKITVSYINPSFQTPFSLQWKYMRGKRGKISLLSPKHQQKWAGKGGQLRHIIPGGAGVCGEMCSSSVGFRLFLSNPWNTRCPDKISLRWALGGIYDPGDFTKPFHRFPCSSQNSGALIHSPALKTWTSLKENGGEKKDIKEIRTLFALTSEIRWWQGPLKKKKLQFFLLTMPNL